MQQQGLQQLHDFSVHSSFGVRWVSSMTSSIGRSFSFITKTPPAAVLIKKECNIESGSGVPNKNKVATISKASVQKIAEMKMRDLNAGSLEAAMSMVAGTARSMGVVVGD